MKLIDADELELDTEWSDYDDGFVSYSKRQINDAEEVKAIPLDKVKQARDEIGEMCRICIALGGTERSNGLKAAKFVLDNLISDLEKQYETD